MAHLTIEGSIYSGFAVHGYCECNAGIKFNQNYCSVCGRKIDKDSLVKEFNVGIEAFNKATNDWSEMQNPIKVYADSKL